MKAELHNKTAKQSWPAQHWVCGLWLACLAALLAPVASAVEETQILDFRPADRLYLSQGVERVNDLTERYFGSSLSGQPTIDLPLLQRLLDQKLVQPEQSEQLQAMGIVLGELLAQSDNLRWVRYLDKYGVSRALQHRDGSIVFPITMIARRFEVGASTDVSALYWRARGDTDY